MPTTSDDALVAICPREHAALVKQAVEDCDVEKQYAVKVQLFEISPNGEAVRVGEPAVVVGREGSVECKTSDDCPVTLKLHVCETGPVAATLSNEPVATESADEVYSSGPDCGQPEAESSPEKSACPVSCSGQPAGETTCPACSGQCPVSCSGQCAASDNKCHACKGECAASCSGQIAASCSGQLRRLVQQPMRRLVRKVWIERPVRIAHRDGIPASGPVTRQTLAPGARGT